MPARPLPSRLNLVTLEDRTTPAQVDILTDVVDANDMKTSLREAVALFNNAPDDFGNDSITFADTLNGQTIVLTAGELAVTGKAGATNTKLSLTSLFSTKGPVVISGNNASRLFNVSAGIALSIEEFKLVGGKADKGGAILNAGTLTLNRTTLDGNTATGTDGGGAVFSAANGKLSLSGVTVSNNTSAGNGGGVLDFGGAQFDVLNSLFAGNTAAGHGGGIIAGNLNLANSTFSGNAANGDGGGVWVNGTVQASHVTVAFNKADADADGKGAGGGLFIDAGPPAGVARLTNSLFAGNTGGEIAGDATGGGDSKSNFVADPASAGGLTKAAGNILGNGADALAAVAANTVIAATLDKNTGSGPLTHALVTTGPAVDKGDQTLSLNPASGKTLSTDARVSFSTSADGTVRVAGANADIGAFEVQNTPPSITLPTNTFKVDEDSTVGVTFSGAGNTITVTDDNVGPTAYDVTLKAADATLTLGGTTGLVGIAGNGTGQITFTVVALTDLNAALATLKLVAGANKTATGLEITVNDKSSGPGKALSALASVPVTITPIVDAPSVTSPSTAKDTAVEVVLTRNPADGPEVTHFKVTNLKGGTLSYVGPQSVANAPIAVNNGDVLFWAGSFFNLTPVEETKFLFTPTPGFEGVASFDVQGAVGFYGENTPGQPPNPAPVFSGPQLTATITVGTPPADTAVPTAALGTAAAVGDSAKGAKVYEFTVVYTDNVQVSAASLDGSDVRVTGPNGFNALASFVSANPLNNGSPRTVTYRIVPPGGDWDAGDNGTYSIAVEAGQVLDTSKNAVAAGSLGTFAVNITAPADTAAPTAKLGAAAAVGDSSKGATAYDFTVTYSDNVALDATTFDGNDVRVTGPNGFSALAAFVKADVAGNGTPRTATYRLVPPGGSWDSTDNGTYTIALTAGQVLDTSKNAAAAGTLGTFAVTVTPSSIPSLVGFPQFAVGTDKGTEAAVQFFNADKTPRLIDPLVPFPGFTGGVRTAAADFNGDGVADVVVGTGPGRATQVQVIDGATLKVLFDVPPFEAAFVGGVYVAAGDVTGDGKADLVITPDEGGGPRVDVYSGAGFGKVASFFAFQDDPNFRGGCRPSVADVNGDGVADVVVSAGFGGGPRIATFDGKAVAAGGTNPARLFGDFFAFEPTLRNGAFVAAGDLNADGKADLIFGGGPGGGPRVTAFSAVDLIASNTQTALANFFGGDVSNRGGVRVAVKNLDGDARADIVIGAGSGAGSKATAYLGAGLQPTGNPTAAFDFDVFTGFGGGVFVG